MTIGSYPDVSLERAVTPILALIDIGHTLSTDQQEAQTNLGVVKTLARSLKDEDFSGAKDEMFAIGAGIERLAQLAAKNLNAAGMGTNQSVAYRATYNAKNLKAATIHKRDCELAKDGKVAGRVPSPRRGLALGGAWLHRLAHLE
jgi:hypothetical protein